MKVLTPDAVNTKAVAYPLAQAVYCGMYGGATEAARMSGMNDSGRVLIQQYLGRIRSSLPLQEAANASHPAAIDHSHSGPVRGLEPGVEYLNCGGTREQYLVRVPEVPPSPARPTALMMPWRARLNAPAGKPCRQYVLSPGGRRPILGGGEHGPQPPPG